MPRTPRAATLLSGALFVGVAMLAAGCSFDSGVGRAECTTNADCNEGATCAGGYCIRTDATSSTGRCRDADGDGYPARPDCGAKVDCDDTDEAIHPGAAERCNGLDDDCDGDVDETFQPSATEGLGLGAPCKVGKGRCTSRAVGVCAEDGSGVVCGATPGPSEQERCNGLDDDCDGIVDDLAGETPLDRNSSDRHCGRCGNNCLEMFANATGTCTDGGCLLASCDRHYFDLDGVAATGCEYFCEASEARGDGPLPKEDTVCNGIDDDCDGDVDEDVTTTIAGEQRGLGEPCTVGTGACSRRGELVCDEDSGGLTCSAEPGSPSKELCDGRDNDCDGAVDEGDPVDGTAWYKDADSDGYGTPKKSVRLCPGESPPSDYVAGAEDCDDSTAQIRPGASERCNGVDDDCDGRIDEDVQSQTWYLDSDGDGYGTPDQTKTSCDDPGSDYILQAGDCDDGDAGINPRATEICDGTDNDCDGTVDEECDVDDDGYCDANATVQGSPPTCPKSPTGTGDDCDDRSKLIHPGATESCNGADDDCDGTVDEGCPCEYDRDSDGVCGRAQIDASGTCAQPTSYEMSEVTCDGLDNDCDGAVDEGCNDDGDDYCDDAMTVVASLLICPRGGGDCNDSDASVAPDASESCDGVDNNCNGSTDEGCDDDGDGFCDAARTVENNPSVCPDGPGDCNDGDAATNPGASEQCDGEDRDCDGTIDEGCTCTYTYDGRSQGVCADGTIGTDGVCDPPPTLEVPDESSCDGLDNDCDGTTDEGCDDDGDGHCDADFTVVGNPSVCPQSPTGTADDCDDTSAAIHEGATEICDDGLDNDCDGSTDCADASCGVSDACGTGSGAVCFSSTCVETACGDGQNNDSDASTDECERGATCNSGTCAETDCSDGIDNDADGATDSADDDCP